MTETYNLVASGSGTAAQAASARVWTAGWKVRVDDDRSFGGACALRGCGPKMVLISGMGAIEPSLAAASAAIGALLIRARPAAGM